MATFYHIFIKPKEGVTVQQIEKKMDLALDWFRYENSSYIVYSTSNVDKLFTRFKPLVEPTGRLFISEFNIENRNGWMAKDFWKWLKKDR